MSLGVFVAGYRWSGSGAVSDWLADHELFVQPRGSEAAYGEIRALNYGLRNLIRIASGDALYGERFGRHALCPDRSLKPTILGTPLTLEQGVRGLGRFLLDAVYMTVAQTRVQPHPRYYETLLSAQLGGDFRRDEQYLTIVREFVSILRREMKAGAPRIPLWQHREIQIAATRLLTLFSERIAPDDRALIFDNAFSGLHPELFHVIDPEAFPVRIILFVRRDPRDQFAELLRYSRGTFPFMVGQFIRRYRKQQEQTQRFIDEYGSSAQTIVRLIDFESFVFDKDQARTRLQTDIETLLMDHGFSGSWTPDKFVPDESKRNIGVWHYSKYSGVIERIANSLPEFLHVRATTQRP